MLTFNRSHGGGHKTVSSALAALTLVAGTLVATAPVQARDRNNPDAVDRPDGYTQRDDDRGQRDRVVRGLAYGLGGAALGYGGGSAYRGYGAPRYGYGERARNYDYRYDRPGADYGRPAYDDRYGG